jgi:hypothetical protein
MAMLESPATITLVAAAAPAAAAITQQPIAEGGAIGGLTALCLIAWRVVRIVEKQLEEQSKHRQLEEKQWRAEDEHRASERAYWAAKAASTQSPTQ